jgi:hypothetical protein
MFSVSGQPLFGVGCPKPAGCAGAESTKKADGGNTPYRPHGFLPYILALMIKAQEYGTDVS